MYRVIKPFTDLKDGNFVYNVGDKYPHEGKASEERVKELSSEANKLGVPLIEEEPEAEEIKEDAVKAEAPKKRTRKKNAD